MATQTKQVLAAEIAPPAGAEQQISPIALDIIVRPIEPKGKLIGFATITFTTPGGAVTVPDFKIFNGKKACLSATQAGRMNPAAQNTGTRRG